MKSEVGFDGFVQQPLPNHRTLRRLFGAKRAMTIFDIGSCEGEDSIRYANFFPKAHIHAFEPIPKNFKIINSNVSEYKLGSRITVNDLALSNKNGKADIHVSSGQPSDAQNTGEWDYGNKSSSLLKPEKIADVTPWLSFKDTIAVKTKTLDSYCKEKDITSIDFIHMDVQGAELMVLSGAKNMIRHTSAIWLEVENVELYSGQPLRDDVEKFMKKNGFTLLVDTVNDIAGDQLYVLKSFLDLQDEKVFEESLSVIIPTYNRSLQVVNAIRSVLDQTSHLKKLEIIVVDDGSTDDTEKKLKDLNIKELTYYKIDHTGKPARARNYGARQAKGEVLAFLDSDDTWKPNKLRDQLPFLELSSTVLVYGQGEIAQSVDELVETNQIEGGESFEALLKTNSIPNSSVILRRSAFNEVEGFDESEKMEVEDYHLWLKVSKNYPTGIKYCGTTVFEYETSGDRISNVTAELSSRRVLYAHQMLSQDDAINDEQKHAIEQQMIVDHKRIKHLRLGMRAPLVSVIMGVYNGEDYLKEAIDSILAQTFRSFEFIIINDGSTDKTSDILSQYDDPRIYIIEQENKGLVASLNIGCSIAVGNYIARMDADDISMPSRFEEEIKLFSTDAEIALVGTFFAYIDEAGTPTGTVMAMPTLDIDLRRALYTVNPFAHGSTMFKRSVFEALSGYTDEYGPTEDYELWRRFANTSAYKFGVVPQALYLYRLNSEGISNKKSAIQAKFTQLISTEQWNKPYIGKSVRSIIVDGKYYQSMQPGLRDQVFNNYYYQNLRIMQHLFIDSHFLTGLKQAAALASLKPNWSRKLIARSVIGGFLRKIGVKK